MRFIRAETAMCVQARWYIISWRVNACEESLSDSCRGAVTDVCSLEHDTILIQLNAELPFNSWLSCVDILVRVFCVFGSSSCLRHNSCWYFCSVTEVEVLVCCAWMSASVRTSCAIMAMTAGWSAVSRSSIGLIAHESSRHRSNVLSVAATVAAAHEA